MIEPHKIKESSQDFADKNSKFRVFLKNRANPKELDEHFISLHNEIFYRDDYDCCKCTNCCKIYDIRIEQKDIAAIAEYLEQTENDFIADYLMPDENEAGCFIMKDKPCCFLGEDGKCGIYERRPLVCRDFPHTKKSGRLYNLLGLFGFAEDCPVVFEIIERLKQIYGFR
jgi:Fe-S-cluster containining protein